MIETNHVHCMKVFHVWYGPPKDKTYDKKTYFHVLNIWGTHNMTYYCTIQLSSINFHKDCPHLMVNVLPHFKPFDYIKEMDSMKSLSNVKPFIYLIYNVNRTIMLLNNHQIKLSCTQIGMDGMSTPTSN